MALLGFIVDILLFLHFGSVFLHNTISIHNHIMWGWNYSMEYFYTHIEREEHYVEYDQSHIKWLWIPGEITTHVYMYTRAWQGYLFYGYLITHP